MDIVKKKEVTLYNIFLKYLVSFCVLTLVALFLSIFIFGIGVSTGVVLPADYAQNNLEGLKKDLLAKEKLDEDSIKYPYSYGFYNENLEVIDSNFNERQLDEAYKYLNKNSFKSNYIYTVIALNDGNCVIAYDIKAHFSSEYLNNIFPYPELIMIILFVMSFIIISIILIKKFGERLKGELSPLKKSTELIMKQDLDFEVTPTNIREFNEVLVSIENMKNALRKSLETQWESEQRKKEQISALAHDIKTPLTIIRGNAELLSEDEALSEDKEYVEFIIKNADKIEKYISILIEISKAENDIDYSIETIDFNSFLQELRCETEMLCKRKDIKNSIEVNNPPESFHGNSGLLIRALTNIIVNSVEYSSEEDKIEILVNCHNNKLSFTIKDCGKGFSEEGLKNATNQFYMEESQRRVGKHYGIGLYITETIAKKHGGELVLKNREDGKGAEVTLSILLTRE